MGLVNEFTTDTRTLTFLLLTHAHCSNALWGLANVFYLAYLPVLVDVHEDVVRYEGQEAPTETEKGRE